MSTQGPEGLRSTVAVQPPSDCCDILPWKKLTAASQRGRVFPWVLVWPPTPGNTGTDIYPAPHLEPVEEGRGSGWALLYK